MRRQRGIRASVAALGAALGLSSCFYPPGPYGYDPGYYSSSGTVYGAAEPYEPYDGPSGYFPLAGWLGASSRRYSHSRPPSYHHYTRSSLCPRCRRNPCACSRSHSYHRSPSYHGSRGHSYHRDYHKKAKTVDRVHRPGTYKVAGGSTGSKVRPQGYHPPEWYKSRGYDLNKLKLRSEDGKYYRSSSSKSSSKSKSKSKKKK